MTKINEHAQAWLHQLRTTTRPKATGYLLTTTGCACALGEAMILEYGAEGHPLSDNGEYYEIRGLHNMLTEELVEKLGLNSWAGASRYGNDQPIWLLNDNGMPKAKLADHVEANAERYFR